MENKDKEFDVVIIGFGPAGAVAAGLLGARGFKVLVVERQKDIYDKPRAIALDHEILRHFDNMGLYEEVIPFIQPFTASCHYGAQGQLIRTIDMVKPPYPLGYTPSMVFTQPELEAVLRRYVEGLETVTIVSGSEFVAFADDGNKIRSELRDDEGRSHYAESSFLLGCDGASSTVRQLAGLTLKDLIFDEPWLVIDVLCGENALAKLPKTSAQFCNPTRPITYIIGPGHHRRWEIMMLPGENPKEMEKTGNIWALLADFMKPDEGTLWRAAAYRFHALVAQDWQAGRVLIAGDAAHQQPPFIGQGMCQGLRDVTNLVWKLERVLTGKSSQALLESYTLERRRHVVQLTTRVKEIGLMICERDPQKAAERDAAIIAQGGGQPPVTTRQEIVPPLEVGVLASKTMPARGLLFPQPFVLKAGKTMLLDKAIGIGWRIILDGHKLAVKDVSDLSTASVSFTIAAITTDKTAAEEGTVFMEIDGILKNWFEQYNAVAILVRPDHYVFGTAADHLELNELVEDLKVQLA